MKVLQITLTIRLPSTSKDFVELSGRNVRRALTNMGCEILEEGCIAPFELQMKYKKKPKIHFLGPGPTAPKYIKNRIWTTKWRASKGTLCKLLTGPQYTVTDWDKVTCKNCLCKNLLVFSRS